MGTCTITVRCRPATVTVDVVEPGVAAVPQPLALRCTDVERVDAGGLSAVAGCPPPQALRATPAVAAVKTHLADERRSRVSGPDLRPVR